MIAVFPGSVPLGTILEGNERPVRRRLADQKLVRRLFLHLLGGGTPDEEVRERLRTDFALARILTADADDAIDLAGEVVGIDQVKLPHPW